MSTLSLHKLAAQLVDCSWNQRVHASIAGLKLCLEPFLERLLSMGDVKGFHPHPQ
jgi:hypothetical protein